MTALGYHVIGRLTDGRVIAPTPPERRTVARLIADKCRGHRLLAFNAADTHLHLQHGEGRACSGRLIQRVQVAIRKTLRLPVGFGAAEHRPIRHQAHLLKAFDYILRQQPRHKLDWDPYRESSNLPDLLGLRVPAQYTATDVRRMLPRVSRAQLLALIGLPALPEAGGPLELVREAALAAVGRSSLVPRSATARAVWRAAMAVLEGRVALTTTARLLGVSPSTLFRLRAAKPDPQLVRAIKLQLGLRQVIAAAPTGCFDAGQRPG